MNIHQLLWSDFFNLLKKLNQNQFIKPSDFLNQSSIGAHFRHSFEFYECVFDGILVGKLNYEKRLRNHRLETDLKYAMVKIERLIEQLDKIELKRIKINLKSTELEFSETISTLPRELLYCLDHAIHHQALIKVGLKEFGIEDYVSPKFGIAYSTLRYRNGQG